MAVSYDLNAIADALAGVFDGLDTAFDYGGTNVLITATSEMTGQANVPAIGVEFDALTYDLSMGRGADAAIFLLHLVVADSDSQEGQRVIRALLSTGKIKDALETHETLGGLVSYAVITGTRTIGSINWAGTVYLGATLEVQVMLS